MVGRWKELSLEGPWGCVLWAAKSHQNATRYRSQQGVGSKVVASMQVWLLRILFSANKLLIWIGLDTPQKRQQEGERIEGQVGGDIRQESTHLVTLLLIIVNYLNSRQIYVFTNMFSRLSSMLNVFPLPYKPLRRIWLFIQFIYIYIIYALFSTR